MPELIKNGPNIPVHLLNELDEQRVVFFAGAGISVGGNSKLPTFSRLIKEVYDRYIKVTEKPNLLVEDVLDWANKDKGDWKPPFPDRAFQLLEQKSCLRKEEVRKIVVELLSVKPTGPLPIHKAILDLSESNNKFRLVTTNFDNRFCQATDRALPIDTAPRLPVAKPNRWKSLVHLHGSISTANVNDLVLTSTDFGEAYLTHGWATQFVTDLFRNFTVVFVGYSIDDTVMRYLLDAMATNRSNENSSDENHTNEFMPAYAFAPFGGKHGCKPEVQIQWESKGVIPVLFENSNNDYSSLNETLTEWASIRKDQLGYWKKVVLEETEKIVKDNTDSAVGRVLWALQNTPCVAEVLAEKPPKQDQKSSMAVVSWLDVFFEEGFIGRQQKDDAFSASQIINQILQQEHSNKKEYEYKFSGQVEQHLIRWVLKHLHIPGVFSSVCFNFEQIPSRYRNKFKEALIKYHAEIPNHLRCGWIVLLDHELPGHSTIETVVLSLCQPGISENEKFLLENEFIMCIAPKLNIKCRPTENFLELHFSGEKPLPTHHSDLYIQLKLVFGEENSWDDINKILKKKDFRIRHAELITEYLDRAIKLIREENLFASGEEVERNVGFDSSIYRPFIAKNDQNRLQDKRMQFVDWVRKSYSNLVKQDPKRADCLLYRWVQINEPLFKRLALHALTKNKKADMQLLRQLLLPEGEVPGIMDKELKPETLALLEKAGPRIPKDILSEILGAIPVN